MSDFNWNHAKAFLKTAQTGSLSAAAKGLKMTQPTLGRQVTALEEELGVALFERVGRGLVLTPSGEKLMAHVQSMEQAADKLSLSASGHNENIAGKIIITATETMAYYYLPKLVVKLRQAEPELEVHVIASNSASDLLRREADIALRAFRPLEPELIGKKLNDIDYHLYAAKSYMKRLGFPSTISQFEHASFLGLADNKVYQEALIKMGFSVDNNNFPVICDNHTIHWELVLNGAGIGVMPGSIGDAAPGVVRVLPDLPPLPTELWLVTHRELRTNIRVRHVFDFLSEHLK